MANQKNQLINVPLNGPLNYSKNKTKISQYEGYNDLNSPMYGDNISPFFYKEGTPSEIKGNSPYIDDDYFLRDENGNILLDLSNSRGLEREVISKFSEATIAVQDETHYIEARSDTIAIHSNNVETDYPLIASKAIYLPKKYHVLVVVGPKYLKIFDSETTKEKLSLEGVDCSLPQVSYIYDDLVDRLAISVYEPWSEEVSKRGTINFRGFWDDRGYDSQNPFRDYGARDTWHEIAFNSSYHPPKSYIIDLNTLDYKLQTFISKTLPQSFSIQPVEDAYIFSGFCTYTLANSKENKYQIGDVYDPSKVISNYNLVPLPYKLKYHVANFPYYSWGDVLAGHVVISSQLMELNFCQAVTYNHATKVSDIPTRNNNVWTCISIPEGTFALGQIYEEWRDEVLITWNYDISYKLQNTIPSFKSSIMSPDYSHKKTYVSNIGNLYTPYASIGTLGSFNSSPIGLETIKQNTTGLYIDENNLLQKYKNKDVFRESYRDGILINLSVAEDKDAIGTLLEPNGAIQGDKQIYYNGGSNSTEAIYAVDQNYWVRVSILPKVPKRLTIMKNFVIVKTTAKINCVDLNVKNGFHHFAPDWNNRVVQYSEQLSNSLNGIFSGVKPSQLGLSVKVENNTVFNSAVNPCYSVTKNPIVGLISDPVVIGPYVSDLIFTAYDSGQDLEAIDFFLATQTPPTYKTSIDNGKFIDNPSLKGLTTGLPVNCPAIFARFEITPYNTVYYIDGTDYYPLTKEGDLDIFIYEKTNILNRIKALFTIQGQTFAVTSSNYIYTVSVVNGIAGIDEVVLNVDGLKYCGAIPNMAIFYSPMDKTLKKFTPDRNLSNLAQATDIQAVYYTAYNPQSFAVYLATSNGIYVYSQFNQYRLPISNVDSITFENKHIYINFYENKTLKVRDMVYEEEPSYNIEPIHLVTKYYGAGNNTITTTDCVYFRLFNSNHLSSNYIEIKEKTLVNGIFETHSSKILISKDMWDKDTNTYYFRYQPKYQRSVGLSLEINTTCAISEIVYSTSPVETVAISKTKLDI